MRHFNTKLQYVVSILTGLALGYVYWNSTLGTRNIEQQIQKTSRSP